jgi:hypothetical protein
LWSHCWMANGWALGMGLDWEPTTGLTLERAGLARGRWVVQVTDEAGRGEDKEAEAEVLGLQTARGMIRDWPAETKTVSRHTTLVIGIWE